MQLTCQYWACKTNVLECYNALPIKKWCSKAVHKNPAIEHCWKTTKLFKMGGGYCT